METDTSVLHAETKHGDDLPLLEPCDHGERLETAHEAVIAILGNSHRPDSTLMSIVRSELSRRNN